MSGFPPPPNQRFAPPPGAGRFPPPTANPPGAPGVGFAPPPPAQQQTLGGFAPPPPQRSNVEQMTSAIGGMNIQEQPAGAHGFHGQPQAPGMFRPPPPPGQTAAVPPGGGVPHFQPPPPGGPPAPGMFFPSPGGSAGAAGGPAIFQPGAPPGGPAPPQMMHVPPPPGGAVGGVPAPGGALATPASSPFYQQQPSQQQMQRVAAGAAPGAPAVVGGGAPQGVVPMVNETIDFNIRIPDRLCRLTAFKLPQTASQATATKIPFGAVLRPLAPKGPNEQDVKTVQPGAAGIVRCKRCRTYINAFCIWSEHGRRWHCNICAQVNDCPSAYFCHLDEQGLRRDRNERPELSEAVVEFIAPAEYMVRAPQEPTYFFVFDVSLAAVRSGMLQHAANAIKASLDELPGRGRTKIGFITFDNAVHYYNLASDLASPQMLVVSDLKELFVPLPDNLLVNLKDSRAVVEAFLDSLPEMFAKNPVQGQSCLGPALKAAFTVMKQIGGKMLVFQSILPNLGDGALKLREQPGIMGTPNEVKLLRPENTWYKDTAIEFSRQQISVDMFLFPYQYMDIAALGELPKYTAGSLHSYVSFNRDRDGHSFEEQLQKTLLQKTAFEAVMRIRCTKGMRITNFYGNFYIRGTDLLALPNCNTESIFAFDLAHDEQNITTSYVTIQAALLYTSSEGERRIRVMTQALPVTPLTSDVMASVDCDACCALLAKQALDVAVKTSLDNARIRLQQVCVDIIRASRSGDKRTVSGYSVPPAGGQPGMGDELDKPIPEHLSLLPLYVLATMKNVAFRGGNDVHPDERMHAHHLLSQMFVPQSKNFVYPRLFAIHQMDDSAGLPAEETLGEEDEDSEKVAGRNRIVLPPVVSLSVEHIVSDGVYLLDNGVEMFLWVGRSADLSILGSLFGVHSLDDMDATHVKVLTSGDSFASRFGAIVESLREDVADPFYVGPRIHVIREGDARMEARFFWFLVEDRASFQGGTYSYGEFMEFVKNPSASSGPRAPAPPGPSGGRPGPPVPPGVPRGPPGQHGMAPGMGHPPPPHPSMGQPPAPGMGQRPGMGHPPPPHPGVGHLGPSYPGQAQPSGQVGQYGPPPGGMAPPRSAPPNIGALGQDHHGPPAGPPSGPLAGGPQGHGPSIGFGGPPSGGLGGPPSNPPRGPPAPQLPPHGPPSGGYGGTPQPPTSGGHSVPLQAAPSATHAQGPPSVPPPGQNGNLPSPPKQSTLPPPPGRAVPSRPPGSAMPPPPRTHLPPPPPPPGR